MMQEYKEGFHFDMFGVIYKCNGGRFLEYDLGLKFVRECEDFYMLVSPACMKDYFQDITQPSTKELQVLSLVDKEVYVAVVAILKELGREL